MKKLLSMFAVFVLVFSTMSMGIGAVPLASSSTKVHDLAGLFTADEVTKLEEKAQDYINTLSMDMVIVTTNNAEGLTSQEYADDFFDYNGFGFKEDKNGVLLLIDMDNREVAVSTKGLAINTYYDRDIETILDDAYAFLSNGRYYSAMSVAVDTTKTIGVAEFKRVAGSSQGRSEIEKYVDEDFNYSNIERPFFVMSPAIVGYSSLVSLIITGIIIAIMLGAQRKSLPGAPTADRYLSGAIHKSNWLDQFAGTNTTRMAIPRDTGSGSGFGGSSGRSGGFGGGGSSHSSSSGSSHGGGSRKF